MKRLVPEYERVIFREEYDPYRKDWGYLAIFPDDDANPGRVACIPFYEGVGGWRFEPYTEADLGYILRKKIIHKNDPRIPELVAAIEQQYGTTLKVVEKMNY